MSYNYTNTPGEAFIPCWTPESQFELAHALYEEALPGNESVVDRIRAWRKRYELAPEKSRLLLDFVHRAMSEARRRAQMLVNLPEGEAVEVQTVSGQPGGGENWYLGNYRSRIEVNTDLPTN